MKIGDAKPTPIPRPFFEDERIALYSHANDKQQLIKFSVVNKLTKEVKDFPVEDYNILKAWLKLQEYTKTIVK